MSAAQRIGRRGNGQIGLAQAEDGAVSATELGDCVRVGRLRPFVCVRIGEQVVRRYDCPADARERPMFERRAEDTRQSLLRAIARALVEEDDDVSGPDEDPPVPPASGVARTAHVAGVLSHHEEAFDVSIQAIVLELHPDAGNGGVSTFRTPPLPDPNAWSVVSAARALAQLWKLPVSVYALIDRDPGTEERPLCVVETSGRIVEEDAVTLALLPGWSTMPEQVRQPPQAPPIIREGDPRGAEAMREATACLQAYGAALASELCRPQPVDHEAALGLMRACTRLSGIVADYLVGLRSI